MVNVTRTISAQHDVRPVLSVLLESGAVQFELEAEEVLVGRGGDAQIVIEHASVSRAHARITLGTTIEVRDVGSRNGTRVRGQRLGKEQVATVESGEPFAVGDVVCVVRRPRVARAQARPQSYEPVGELVALVARSDISVVLHGETGVGKEVTARRIHELSKRKAGPFVGINCAAVPENLIESELFGYERGAFSGADRAKPGLFEAADGGTLFLDEVAELSMAVQAKLLRVLEERVVQRLGALKPRPIDARFIAASHRDLESAVDDGVFREDLFYRLNGMTVRIPPLRERVDEIEGIARNFIALAAEAHGQAAPALSADALSLLRAHSWPGNVRELRNAMDRALLLAAGAPELLPAHFSLARRRAKGETSTSGAAVPDAARAAAPAEAPEVARIHAALREAAGNQKRAAELLGISRRTLINRLEQYGIARPRKT